MSASMTSQHQLVACPFIDPPDKFYVCYKTEICCKEGCCSIYSYKYFHTWYFWLALLVLFALYRYGCLYCKKLEDEQCRRERAHEIRQRAQTPFSLANRRCSNAMTSTTEPTSAEAKSSDPPPDYAAALALPRTTAANHGDEVPSYEQAVTVDSVVANEKVDE